MNTLYYGDNLDILQKKIPSDCVDLIYLDPPFQSGRNYNQIFQPQAGTALISSPIRGATAELEAFEDTWQWGDKAEDEYLGLITGTITKEKPSQKLIELIKAMRGYLGECSMMAYLSMMAPRLVEMRRAMKETGSIYLHCDPTASHYLKLLMDAVFEVKNFRNEIIWKRSLPHGNVRQMFGRSHDVILFYSKGDGPIWNRQYDAHRQEYLDKFYRFREPETGRVYRLVSCINPNPNRPNLTYEWKGVKKVWKWTKERMQKAHDDGLLVYSKNGIPSYKNYLDEMKGTPMQDIWADIPPLMGSSQERLGYPTQKPETLLERIIKASSNEGDLVLDPFCGCGTTVAVAEQLGRRWIGIDITYLSIDVIKKRFERNNIQQGIHFEIDGEPTDVYSAEKLAAQSPFQFQIWCISKLDATPSQRKTGDRGIDGIINFIDATKKDKAGKGIISVKGTQSVNPEMVRELIGTVKSENADFGILVTLKKATRGMKTAAVKEGYAESSKNVPKIQLLNAEDLFKKPIPVILPGQVLSPFKNLEIKKEQRELF